MDFKEVYDDTCSTVGKACRTGNLAALKSLITAGKPVDVKDNRGWFPIHEAAYGQEEPACLEILIQQEDCDVNWQSFEGETALYLASKVGNIGAIKLLLQNGADVNLTTNENLSPLWEATVKSHLACMKLLVAAGANVNEQTYTGDTPLHATAERGHSDILSCLLDNGADMSIRSDQGLTPVFIASQFAKHEYLKIMLEKADQKPDTYTKQLVDAAAHDNATPLLIAAQTGSPQCIQLLLDRGANPDIPCDIESEGDDIHYVPLQMAVHQDHPSCVALLAPVTKEVEINCCESFGSNHPVCLAIAHTDIRCIKLLLDNGYSWQKVYKQFLTYLQVSVEEETQFCSLQFFEEMSFNVAHYLLRVGIMTASLNNAQIRTTSFSLRDCEVMKFILLLKYGANPTLLDSNGVNQLTLHILQGFDVQLVCALIKYGTELQLGPVACFNTAIVIPSRKKYLMMLMLQCLSSHILTDKAAQLEQRYHPHLKRVDKMQEASWSLRHASRVKIVRQLISRGNYTNESVRSLQLPTILADYLLYKEYDDYSLDDRDDIVSVGTAMREEFEKLEETDSTIRMLMAENEKKPL